MGSEGRRRWLWWAGSESGSNNSCQARTGRRYISGRRSTFIIADIVSVRSVGIKPNIYYICLLFLLIIGKTFF